MTTVRFNLLNPPTSPVVFNALLGQDVTVHLMLDTGARFTVIKPWVADALNLDLSSAPRQVISTATGLVNVPRVMLPRLAINSIALENVEAVVIPLPSQLGVSGLLGMSFLAQCRLTLDVPHRWVELSVD